MGLLTVSAFGGWMISRWLTPWYQEHWEEEGDEDDPPEEELTPEQRVSRIRKTLKELEEELGGRILLMIDHEDHTQIDPHLRNRHWVDLEDEVQFLHLLHQMQGAPLYLMLCTDGGSISSSDAMVRVLREYPESTALVPYKAYSAGSLLALSTKHLWMGEYGLLSPFDPQLDLRLANNKPQSFSSRLLMELNPERHPQMETLAHLTQLDAQVYHQDNMLTTTQILSDKYPPEVVQEVKEHLCTGDYPHSKPFHRTDLRKMGLEVGEMPDPRWMQLAGDLQEYRNHLERELETSDKKSK